MVLLLGLILVLAGFAWIGRRPWVVAGIARFVYAAGSLSLAAAAVLVALRGAWIASVALILGSLALGYRTRASGAVPPGPADRRMSETEARSILGVGPDASEAEVNAAYRHLMKTAHPDRGGAKDRAVRINAARAVLRRSRV